MAVSKSIRKPASGTTQLTNQIARSRDRQRKKRHYKASSDLRIEYSEERPQTHRDQPPKLGLNFAEAVGKVIAFVNVINDPPNWQALEIRFTDRTLLHFELGSALPQITPTYMEARHGNLELIRSYGTLLTDDERTAWES